VLGVSASFSGVNMYFFRSSFKNNFDHLIPSYDFVSTMKSDRNMYNCQVSELAVGDIIFDIVFLSIIEKHFSCGKNPGYHLMAVNAEDEAYNAFIFEGKGVYIVNPDYLDDLIESNLYSG
jgi:hypothetical protein